MSKSYGAEEKEMCKLLDRMTADNEFWHDKAPLKVNFQRFGFQLREVDFERETIYYNDYPLRNRNQSAVDNSGLSIVKNDKNVFEVRLDVWPFERSDLSVFSVPGKYIYIKGEHPERDEDGSSVSRKFQRYYRVPRGSATDTTKIKCEYFGDKTIAIRVPKNEVSVEVNKDLPVNLSTFRYRPVPTDKQYSEEMPEAQKVAITQKEAVHVLPNEIYIATEDSKEEESSKSEGENDRESTKGVSDSTEDSKDESSKSENGQDRKSPEGLSDDSETKMSDKESLAAEKEDDAKDSISG